MNCQTCREHFADLLYETRGEALDATLATGLHEHLKECQACEGTLRELRETQSWLDALDEESSAAAVTEPVAAAALYRRLARLERRRDLWRWAALAAAAAIVLCAGLWLTIDRAGDASAPMARGVPSTATPSQALPAEELQRLAARLEDQERLLTLLAQEIRAVEGRQGRRLAALEDVATRLDQSADLGSLRLSAMQHDIDRLREFVTGKSQVAQLRDAD